MNRAVIAVGSNIDPLAHIARAEALLRQEQTLLAVSPFVRTRPRGFAEQADFVNGAFYIETALVPAALNDYLKDLETRLGRVRTANRNGPRTIDLDVIVLNGTIVDADFYRYDFVRQAVLELLPELKTPPRDETETPRGRVESR